MTLMKTFPPLSVPRVHALLIALCFLAPTGCSSTGSSGTGGHVASGGNNGTGGGTGTGGRSSTGGDSGGGTATGGSHGTATGGAATGGTATGGTSTGGAATGGASTGGTATGGASTGGASTGGSGSAGRGTGGAAAGGGGSTGGNSLGGGPGGASGGPGGGTSAGAYRCPSQSYPALQLPADMPTRIAGAPPSDAFNNNGNDYTNVEGPVWIGDALYVSEIGNGTTSPARIIKITGDDAVSVAVTDSGSNGLAVDADGNIVSANQGIGGIVRFNPATGARTTVIDSYNGKRFNSPNDLTIRSDGGIFFTDPSFQASGAPQPVTGVYFVPPGSTTAKLSTGFNNPNGITLSIDEKTIYIGDGSGVLSYPVAADGTLGKGTVFGGITGSSDGMTIDCAGNLYVVRVDVRNVTVLDPSGKTLGTPITVPGGGQITNVAFGGADHKTLYITVMGTGTVRGVFKISNMPIPGMPF
jgi:gluconolactonase